MDKWGEITVINHIDPAKANGFNRAALKGLLNDAGDFIFAP